MFYFFHVKIVRQNSYDIIPRIALLYFLCFPAAFSRFIIQLLVFNSDPGVRRNGSGDKCIAPDYRVFANYRIPAEDGSSCINGNIILNSGMTLDSGQLLSASCGQCANGHPLIYFYVFTDPDCCSELFQIPSIDFKPAEPGELHSFLKNMQNRKTSILHTLNHFAHFNLSSENPR